MEVTIRCLTIGSILIIALPWASLVQQRTEPSIPGDIPAEVGYLILRVTHFVRQARTASGLSDAYKDVMDIQRRASALISRLSRAATECETQSLVDMAAGRVGSQEVLGLLMARGTRELLSAQLDMSLTLLIQIVRQIQDDLLASTDAASHLTALVFAANLTASVIVSAESSLSSVTSPSASHLGAVPVRIGRQTSPLTGTNQ